MADLVDEIKARLPIEQLVGQYVQLKKAGRNFKGLCPFHSEKSPSFVVSPEKQICHCFGCNKGGDIFTFIEEVEGVSFSESLELLADKVGLKDQLKKHKSSKGQVVKKSEKDLYYKAHELACDFFEEQLHSTNDGKKVLEYLHRRGVSDEMIKEFRIGFAPDKYDSLYPKLLKAGIPKDVLLKSGLINAKNLASDNVYDKYRARLIFPIFNGMGKICGFGGRALKKDQMPKYLNSPENPIYNKSKELYGLSHAKKFIKQEDKVLLVEGYFDVILPYQEGIKYVVASSGTALSSHQVKVLKRLTSNVVSSFDTDSAGFEATKRSYFLFQEQGVEMKTVSGVDEKDPADFVREHGEEFKELINRAPNFVEFYLERLRKEIDFKSLSGRRKVVSELSPCFKAMSSTDRDYFVRDLALKLSMKEEHLYDEMERAKLPNDHPARMGSVSDGDTANNVVAAVRKITLEEMILGIVLSYPNLFEKSSELLNQNDFSEDLKTVYKLMVAKYNSSRDISGILDEKNELLPGVSDKLRLASLYVEDRYQDFSEQTLALELEKLIDKLKKDRLKENLNELRLKIVEAEKAGDIEKLKDLLKLQQDLLTN